VPSRGEKRAALPGGGALGGPRTPRWLGPSPLLALKYPGLIVYIYTHKHMGLTSKIPLDPEMCGWSAGKSTLADGSLYVGEWANGLRHGRGAPTRPTPDAVRTQDTADAACQPQPSSVRLTVDRPMKLSPGEYRRGGHGCHWLMQPVHHNHNYGADPSHRAGSDGVGPAAVQMRRAAGRRGPVHATRRASRRDAHAARLQIRRAGAAGRVVGPGLLGREPAAGGARGAAAAVPASALCPVGRGSRAAAARARGTWCAGCLVCPSHLATRF
jgi:hypothetical protein